MSDGTEENDSDAAPTELHRLRYELALKHTQNRTDIRDLKSEQSAVRQEVSVLSARIDPYLDNGQPGLFSRMSAKLDTVMEQLSDIRVKQGIDAGRRDVYGWLRAVMASVIVGLLIVLAQHLWK